MWGMPMKGQQVTFVDHRDQQDTTLLPNPKLLRLHAAVAGIMHMCGAAEYIETYLRDLQDTRVLATDGGSSIMALFSLHSMNKV
jgi:hypothetical protein